MKRIKEEGYLGLKGYWAERTQQADGGKLAFALNGICNITDTK